MSGRCLERTLKFSLTRTLEDLSIPATEAQQPNAHQLPKNTSSNSLSQSGEHQPVYDALEQSRAFRDAKKKLRIVLSWVDNCTYNFMPAMQFKWECVFRVFVAESR